MSLVKNIYALCLWLRAVYISEIWLNQILIILSYCSPANDLISLFFCFITISIIILKKKYCLKPLVNVRSSLLFCSKASISKYSLPSFFYCFCFIFSSLFISHVSAPYKIVGSYFILSETFIILYFRSWAIWLFCRGFLSLFSVLWALPLPTVKIWLCDFFD